MPLAGWGLVLDAEQPGVATLCKNIWGSKNKQVARKGKQDQKQAGKIMRNNWVANKDKKKDTSELFWKRGLINAGNVEISLMTARCGVNVPKTRERGGQRRPEKKAVIWIGGGNKNEPRAEQIGGGKFAGIAYSQFPPIMVNWSGLSVENRQNYSRAGS